MLKKLAISFRNGLWIGLHWLPGVKIGFNNYKEPS